MGATVVVTGATGFIGSRVARFLLARGDDVVAIVRDPEVSASENLRGLGARLVCVTCWGSNAKAVAALGFAPRAFEVGVRDAFGHG